MSVRKTCRCGRPLHGSGDARREAREDHPGGPQKAVRAFPECHSESRPESFPESYRIPSPPESFPSPLRVPPESSGLDETVKNGSGRLGPSRSRVCRVPRRRGIVASPFHRIFKRLLLPGRVERTLKQSPPGHLSSELIGQPRLSGIRNWEPLKQVIVSLLRGEAR